MSVLLGEFAVSLGWSCPTRFKGYGVSGIHHDSREVQPGEIFFALAGGNYDGHCFTRAVIDKGVKIIVAERFPEPDIADDVCWIQVSGTESHLRRALVEFYGDPSSKISVFGVTGTNGKTTVSYLLESIYHSAGSHCGVIGSVNYRMGGRTYPATRTTPGMVEMQRFMSMMVDDGVDHCVMEVSSHALDQDRVGLIAFRSAIFTNLTGDHLDYHKTMDAYFSAKAKLFLGLSEHASAVINADDPYGRKLYSKTKARICSYGLHKTAEVMAKDLEMNTRYSRFRCVTPEGDVEIRTSLIGEHNVSNILAAVASAYMEGISLDDIKNGIESLEAVPGRMERLDYGQKFSVLIDYAHTHDALEHVLRSLKTMSGGRIIVVFGCGGDRDRSKRSKMGKIAESYADHVIVTSDNPRGEDPESIIDDIIEGFQFPEYERITNRKVAIERALDIAVAGDVVLIAGKGHERYQIFKEGAVQFDERSIVRDALLC
jgi:UDP-N-acetylmuramoyl-L-alanyl-D-glutamate--2,6-diaminopimelate ligase